MGILFGLTIVPKKHMVMAIPAILEIDRPARIGTAMHGAIGQPAEKQYFVVKNMLLFGPTS